MLLKTSEGTKSDGKVLSCGCIGNDPEEVLRLLVAAGSDPEAVAGGGQISGGCSYAARSARWGSMQSSLSGSTQDHPEGRLFVG